MRLLSARDDTEISFTAFIVASLARAIASNPKVQAYRDWRRRLVVFHDVDVVTMIEPEPGAVAIPHIIGSSMSFLSSDGWPVVQVSSCQSSRITKLRVSR